jgi:O-antigen ligase
MIAEALLISALVFGPLAFGATEFWSRSILEGLLFCVAVSCAARGQSNRDNPIRRTLLPAVAFILLIGVIQFLNPVPLAAPAGLLPFTVSKEATGSALVLWTSYAALLFGAASVFQSSGAAKRVIWTIFLLGALIAVVGLMQRGQGNLAYYGVRPIHRGNPFGPYTNYDHAASMLVLAAFAGAGVWLSRLETIRKIEQFGKRIEAWMIQLLIAFLLAIIVYAICFIRSRGAIHAMVISAAIVGAGAIYSFARPKVRLLGGLVLAAALGIYTAIMVRNKAMIGFEEAWPSSTIYRLALYGNSLGISKDHPIFGTGLASYVSVFPTYQDPKWVPGRIDHAHNDWLELLCETGFAGLALYLAAILSLYRRIFGAWLAERSFESRCLSGACIAATISFCIHGLVDFSFQIPANAVLFLALLACAASFASRAGARAGG